jgi:stage II sporulation protein D
MPKLRHRLLATCFLFALIPLGARAGGINLRILVAEGPALSVDLPSSFSMFSGSGQPLADGTAGGWEVSRTPGGTLSLSGQGSGQSTLLLIPQAGVFQVQGRSYRGDLILRVSEGAAQAIDVVPMSEYLDSVVPAEMPSEWPMAALEAQAIVARTYAIRHLHPAGAYDLCATTDCQLYPGLGNETSRTDRAVAATAGEIVAWQGRPADTFFSSNDGGYTASSQEVWGHSLPYLTSRPDPFSAGPVWSVSVPLAQVADLARADGISVGILQSVTVLRSSSSGRPTALLFLGSQGQSELSGPAADRFVRQLSGKSSRANLAVTGNTLTIRGEGNGHGVGMSQWGAKQMAAQGYSADQILGFYFPGAELGKYQVAGSPPGAAKQVAGGP